MDKNKPTTCNDTQHFIDKFNFNTNCYINYVRSVTIGVQEATVTRELHGRYLRVAYLGYTLNHFAYSGYTLYHFYW